MYYLATENFRLTDRNEQVSVDQVLQYEDQETKTSRSLSAAIRSGWLKRISDEEAKKYQERYDKSIAKVSVKEEKKVQKPVTETPAATTETKLHDVVKVSVEDNSFNHAVADEVFDPTKLIEAANARKSVPEKVSTVEVKDTEVKEVKNEIKSSMSMKIKKKRKGK